MKNQGVCRYGSVMEMGMHAYRQWLLLACIPIVSVLLMGCPVVVVDVNTTCPAQNQDVQTWATAFNSIPEAISDIGTPEETTALFVAGGTYNETVTLIPGIIVIGSLVGTEDLDLAVAIAISDITANPTVITGVSGQNDAVIGTNDSFLLGVKTNNLGMLNSGKSPIGGLCHFTRNAVNAVINQNNSMTLFSYYNYTDNYAFQGGALYNSNNSTLALGIVGCTIYDNTTTDPGSSAIHNVNSGTFVANTIAWGNDAGRSTMMSDQYSNVTVGSSALENWSGISDPPNIEGDPLLDQYQQPELYREGQFINASPCVDSGLDASATGFTIDYYFNPRPAGQGCDVGAIELPDTDGDGLLDAVELDTAEEGEDFPWHDWENQDSDSDEILDGAGDTDGDGVPDGNEGYGDNDEDDIADVFDMDNVFDLYLPNGLRDIMEYAGNHSWDGIGAFQVALSDPCNNAVIPDVVYLTVLDQILFNQNIAHHTEVKSAYINNIGILYGFFNEVVATNTRLGYQHPDLSIMCALAGIATYSQSSYIAFFDVITDQILYEYPDLVIPACPQFEGEGEGESEGEGENLLITIPELAPCADYDSDGLSNASEVGIGDWILRVINNDPSAAEDWEGDANIITRLFLAFWCNYTVSGDSSDGFLYDFLTIAPPEGAPPVVNVTIARNPENGSGGMVVPAPGYYYFPKYDLEYWPYGSSQTECPECPQFSLPLTAVAGPAYTFKNWSGSYTSPNAGIIVKLEDGNVYTANFLETQSALIPLEATPSGDFYHTQVVQGAKWADPGCMPFSEGEPTVSSNVSSNIRNGSVAWPTVGDNFTITYTVGANSVTRKVHVVAAPNVMLIMFDDMNDYVGYFDEEGHGNTVTPNMDLLAQEGRAFRHAYCPSPVCLASRTAMLTGQYPAATGIYDNKADWYRNPELVDRVLPKVVNNAGYDVFGVGKVFHGHKDFSKQGLNKRANGGDTITVDLPSAEGEYTEESHVVALPELTRNFSQTYWGVDGRKPIYDAYGFSDNPAYRDEATTFMAQEALDLFASDMTGVVSNRFFLSVGLRQTHLPLIVPEARWFNEVTTVDLPAPFGWYSDWNNLAYNSDLYTDAHIIINAPYATIRPPITEGKLIPSECWQRALLPRRARALLNDATLLAPIKDAGHWRSLVHAYLATIHYNDYLMGQLIATLKDRGMDKSTVIIAVSDNGWHLGEQNHLMKMTLWEHATRVPLIIRDPRYPDAGGVQVETPVSILDLYKTITDLTSAVNPPDTHGHSLKAMLSSTDPNVKRGIEGESEPVLTSFTLPRRDKRFSFHSVRDDQYSYILYNSEVIPDNDDYYTGHPEGEPVWEGEEPLEELYDRNVDPLEFTNLLNDGYSGAEEAVINDLNDYITHTGQPAGDPPAKVVGRLEGIYDDAQGEPLPIETVCIPGGGGVIGCGSGGKNFLIGNANQYVRSDDDSDGALTEGSHAIKAGVSADKTYVGIEEIKVDGYNPLDPGADPVMNVPIMLYSGEGLNEITGTLTISLGDPTVFDITWVYIGNPIKDNTWRASFTDLDQGVSTWTIEWTSTYYPEEKSEEQGSACIVNLFMGYTTTKYESAFDPGDEVTFTLSNLSGSENITPYPYKLQGGNLVHDAAVMENAPIDSLKWSFDVFSIENSSAIVNSVRYALPSGKYGWPCEFEEVFFDSSSPLTPISGVNELFLGGWNYTSDMLNRLDDWLPDLTSLDLTGSTFLSGVTTWSMSGLTEINLAGCNGVTEDLLEIIFDYCEDLEKLDLSHINIGGFWPWPAMPSLKELNLGNCTGVTYALLNAIDSGCPNLNTLVLSNVSFYQISWWPEMSELKELNLSKCTYLTPQKLKIIADKCVNIRNINLSESKKDSYNSLDALKYGNPPISCLASLSYLERVDISKCAVSQLAPLISNAGTLLELNLSDCDSIINSAKPIVNFTKLEVLDMSFCDTITQLWLFLDSSDNTLVYDWDLTDRENSHLQSVNVSGCTQLTEIKHLQKCNALKYIDLSNTAVTDVKLQEAILNNVYIDTIGPNLTVRIAGLSILQSTIDALINKGVTVVTN